MSQPGNENHSEDSNGQIQEGKTANGKGTNSVTCKENEAEHDAEGSEFRFGCFSWTPRWMQTFNRAPWLLVVLCGFCTAQVNRHTYLIGSVFISHDSEYVIC